MPPRKSRGRAGGRRDPRKPPESVPTPTTVVGGDGKTYRIDEKTGLVYNEQSQVVSGASYDPDTGEFSLPGYPVMDLEKGLGAPTAGETYGRNYESDKFFTVMHEGKTYYVNKVTSRVFEPTTDGQGRYVGEWLEEENTLSLFDLGDDEEEEEPPPEEEEPDDTPTAEQEDAFVLLKDFLSQWGFGEDAHAWAWQVILNDWSQERIALEMRSTDWYKAAYPENDLRRENDLPFLNEAAIRAFREEAMRLGHQVLGVDISRDQIAQIIGHGWSIAEFEHRLQVVDLAQQNAGMRTIMEMELGRGLTDLEWANAIDPEIDTAEFDDAYNAGRYKATAYNLGFGMRSDEEMQLLVNLGVTAEEASSRYRTVEDARPMFERLAGIESGITGANLFNDVPIEELIKGFVIEDPETKARLNAQVAREFARHNMGGGVAASGQGQLTGLQTRDQRTRTV